MRTWRLEHLRRRGFGNFCLPSQQDDGKSHSRNCDRCGKTQNQDTLSHFQLAEMMVKNANASCLTEPGAAGAHFISFYNKLGLIKWSINAENTLTYLNGQTFHLANAKWNLCASFWLTTMINMESGSIYRKRNQSRSKTLLFCRRGKERKRK